MQFWDGTISIQPGDQEDGYAIKSIQFGGLQDPIKIIDQILDSYSPGNPDIVNVTDSIVQAIQKMTPSLPTAFSVIHITSGSSSNTNLTGFQNTVIFDSGATGKSATLISSSDPSVIQGYPYRFMMSSGVLTSNTVKVVSGDHLNGTVNGTYTLSASATNWISATAVADSSGWFISI